MKLSGYFHPRFACLFAKSIHPVSAVGTERVIAVDWIATRLRFAVIGRQVTG
jgi:hypothetical protein